jgi:hypothetical protein
MYANYAAYDLLDSPVFTCHKSKYFLDLSALEYPRKIFLS